MKNNLGEKLNPHHHHMLRDDAWYPGKRVRELLDRGELHKQQQEVQKLPFGFSIERSKDGLTEPYYLHNDAEAREVLTREGMFAFPLAMAGFVVAGVPGVVAGHVIGAVAGYVRHQRIYGNQQ